MPSNASAGPSAPGRTVKRPRRSSDPHPRELDEAALRARLPPLATVDDPVPRSSTIKRSVAVTSTTGAREDEDEDGPVEAAAEHGEDGGIDRPAKKLKSQVRTALKKSKEVVPGIIYISRVPPGMTPQKVRHLMARWGEVGKVYAQKRDAPTGYNPQSQNQKKTKHERANYTEAWVEFKDKNVAKTVARMLNAEVIGGKKGDRWRDDIWTMKYLSGFKWEMLGEQVAYERQSHQSRLRAEITRAKTEQGEYLRNVELARVLNKRKAKKEAAGQGRMARSDRTMPERSPTPPRDSSSNSTTNAVTHAHEQLDQLHTTLRDLFDFMLQHAAAERAHIDTINFKNAENAERARRRARPYWWGPFGIILSCLLVTTILGGTILLCAARGRWNISRSTSSSSSSSQIALASSECWIIPVLRASQGCWIATLVLLVPFSFYIWYRWEEQDISDEEAVGVLVILFAMLAYLIGGIQCSNDGLSEAFGSGC
ncbi:RNA-binding ATPase activator esf2 [Saitozyma podzolica]|uniref:18S rRNA factor 2 n=1 Tax=Saitozyma podzolica TaxID=1890683 RepID=A0A427YWX9_9TREE|nr:RNA-binding ATPase activator esf2 [Saitozyma podzolica]